MTKFNRLIVTHPWFVIVSFALATVLFAVRLPKLVVDFDIDAILPHDHPEIIYKSWALEYFGIEEPAMILILNDGPYGIFTPETLALVAHISEKMSVVDGVVGDDVISLSEVDNITADGDSLVVDPFFEEPPTTQAEADRIREAVFENPMMVGTVVSSDGHATIVGADSITEFDKGVIRHALADIVREAPHGSSQLFLAGRPIVESEVIEINRRETARVLPIVVITAATALALSLHSVRGVLLPMLVVLSSIIWSVGLMAWTGRVYSALNSALPMTLIPIGIADGIHVIHHYMHTLGEDPDKPQREAVFETMQGMFPAVVMTSLTTAAGLASLATSSIASNRDFGIFCAFGTLAAMVFSLTVLPALLVVLPRPRRGLGRFVQAAATEPGPLRRAVEAVGGLLTRRPRTVVITTVVLVMIAIGGLPWLRIDGSLLQNYPPDNSVRVADAVMVKHFGGSFPLEIVVDAGEHDAWKSPANLRALDAFQAEVESIEGVGETRSIADYLRRMNAVMNPDDPGADSIPGTHELVAQYLLLYSISGEPDDFDDVVDYDYAIANVRTQTASDHSPDLTEVLTAIDLASREHLEPLGLSAHASGAGRENHTFMEVIVKNQIVGLSTALLLVCFMASLMFRSILGGLLTSLPVALATITTFGGLGWIGETVGVTTALMSAIAIGVGVDYAVHFVARYRHFCRQGVDRETAMRTTLNSSGIAILYNAVVVVAGFLAMATSEFLPPRAMGLLVSWNMVVCFFATITTLAALLWWLDPAFLRSGSTDGSSPSPHR